MRKSAVKDSTEVQPRINAPRTFVRYFAGKRLLTSGKGVCKEKSHETELTGKGTKYFKDDDLN